MKKHLMLPAGFFLALTGVMANPAIGEPVATKPVNSNQLPADISSQIAKPQLPFVNLIVQNAIVNFATKTVTFTEKNTGTKNAGPHLTYVEINTVNAAAIDKPQSQYSVNVPGIAAGATWSPAVPIPFSRFSTRPGINLSTLTRANLVVTADAKNMVQESNENDNVYNVIR